MSVTAFFVPATSQESLICFSTFSNCSIDDSRFPPPSWKINQNPTKSIKTQQKDWKFSFNLKLLDLFTIVIVVCKIQTLDVRERERERGKCDVRESKIKLIINNRWFLVAFPLRNRIPLKPGLFLFLLLNNRVLLLFFPPNWTLVKWLG